MAFTWKKKKKKCAHYRLVRLMAKISKTGDYVSVCFPEETARKPLGYLLNVLRNDLPTLQVIKGGLLDALYSDSDDDTWYVISFLFGPTSDGAPWTSMQCLTSNMCQLAFHTNHQRPFAIVLTKKAYLATNSYVTSNKKEKVFSDDGMLFFANEEDDSFEKGDRIVQINGTLVTATVAESTSEVNGEMLVCTRRTPAAATTEPLKSKADNRDIFERMDDWVSATLYQIGL